MTPNNNRSLRMAFLWETCGPYHVSRLRAIRSAVGEGAILALEISSKSSTYEWRVGNRFEDQIHTLFPQPGVKWLRSFFLFYKLRKIFRLQRVTVVFVPSYWPSYALVTALAAKSLGLSVVFMGDSHYASGSNEGFAVAIKRLFIKLYDSALVAGSIHRGFLRYLGVPLGKIFDGYDTVDNEHFKCIAAQARKNPRQYCLDYALPDKYILSLGRFVPKKNLESVINAYAQLVEGGKHAGHHLVFVGSGIMQIKLMDVAHKWGLRVVNHANKIENPTASPICKDQAVGGEIYRGPERRKLGGAIKGGRRSSDPKINDENVSMSLGEELGVVHFYPFAQIETVPIYYALATAFVLASTSDEWGLVVNEAMASGCPVVVSRSVGASLDLVVPDKTGFRFFADNVHELAWCMERLCRDPAYALELGINAQAHIEDWSNDRFVKNALLAAEAAIQPKKERQDVLLRVELESQSEKSGERIWFLQTCFPDYRMPVFRRLNERLGQNFHLFSGTSYFTDDIRMTPDLLDWHSLVENRFFLRRKFLWQIGACSKMLEGDVVVMELNPRILSHWVILAVRALWGAPTLLWGHAWGREDKHSIRNVLRLYMMRLASGTVTYTKTQRDELRRVFPDFSIFSATNSLIKAAECNPINVDIDKLDTIIYVGRINGPKKVQLLVDAFIRAKLPNYVKLKIVGSGQERARIEEGLLSHPPMAGRVQFLGHVQNHEILRSLYSTAFCAVSPGYVGLGAIQSFSFGVPLVLADKEPHAPEVEACSEMNTVFFESDNASSLTLMLEHLWADRAKWLAKRQELAAWTAEYYSVEAMVEGFVEAISAVKERRRIHRKLTASVID
jgi:glycosyltransferase involved in cell wall biosynthesis